ncbi:MAG: DHH family phosphoesterase [Anaerolineales bacterium]|nr:MAG: DHH family phosphoesterase [Anaerolineales bacterium]
MIQDSENHLDLLFAAVGDADAVLILSHNDPDPDAIASTVALRHLLMEALGVESSIAYQGIIGRAENRALVHYLGQPLRPLTDADLAGEAPIALVDTQPGAGNNALPDRSEVMIVIDHHTWRKPTAGAAYVDVRPEAGATSTILTEYLQETGLELQPPLATALFYGIKADTRGLSGGAGPADTAAYLYLQPLVDTQALAQIEYAQVPVSYFKSFDATLRAARVYDGVVVAYVGPMAYPDLTAEMAHLLLRPEKSRWVVCMGVHRKVLILSVRTQSPTGGADQVATILPPLPAFDGLVRGAFLAKLVTTAVFFQPQKEVWDS